MPKLKLYWKYWNLFLNRQIVNDIDIGESYTKVSRNYDEVFLTTMHRYNDRMLEELIKRTKKIEHPQYIRFSLWNRI